MYSAMAQAPQLDVKACFVGSAAPLHKRHRVGTSPRSSDNLRSCTLIGVHDQFKPHLRRRVFCKSFPLLFSKRSDGPSTAGLTSVALWHHRSLSTIGQRIRVTGLHYQQPFKSKLLVIAGVTRTARQCGASQCIWQKHFDAR